MNLNDKLHGFAVTGIEELPELPARLVRMTHEKTGADLVWLDREDDNMTFGVAFKTIPQDDTGVFHILEHSVLSGSAKYPVKEPFVELLKSSMNTFLNAMTFPDKTFYPFCSRNRKDFLNLLDVYLDAVFHPLSVTDPHAFRQEGWHYALEDPNGELTVNGVVYNEMKGAYASPDTVLMGRINALLFPDSCYGYESGGHPDHIPELTYENYLASHGRFYHPSNARLFLDGRVDTDAVLSKLDEVLGAYSHLDVDAEISVQPAVTAEDPACLYEIGASEDETNKAILSRAFVFGTFEDTKKIMAANMLSRVLAGSNESPLKAALLGKGLAEDVEIEVYDGIRQPFLVLVLRNTDPARTEEVWAAAEGTLRELVKNGLDRGALHAALDKLEFSNREKDMGGIPTGLVYGIMALESWLYDGDPAQNLQREEVFAQLRRGIDEGWFETFLAQLLDSPHQAKLTMLPSKTLGAEKQTKEKARLAAEKAARTPEELIAMAAEYAAFREKQAQPDTPEAVASLPRLALSDVEEAITPIPQKVLTLGDTTVLHQDLATGGITYLELYFDLSDLTPAQLQDTSFLLQLLGKTATEDKTVLALRSTMDSLFGRFSLHMSVLEKEGKVTPYAVVSLSVLDTKKEKAAALLTELLRKTRFTDGENLLHVLRQGRMGLEQSVVGGGNRYGVTRAGASRSAAGALDEMTKGISFLRWLQKAEKEYETSGKALAEQMAVCLQNTFTRGRVLASVTGAWDEGFLTSVLEGLAEGGVGAPAEYAPMDLGREGFVIPAEVAFAAKANRAPEGLPAAAYVACQILTFGHLWNAIRVQGGAYGAGLRSRPRGDVLYYSFRDPNPAGAVAAFDASGAALRSILEAEDSVDRYIISTVTDIDPLLTPRAKGAAAAENYLTGRTDAALQAERSALLKTDKEALISLSRQLDALTDQAGLCVIGGRALLEALPFLDSVEDLQ